MQTPHLSELLVDKALYPSPYATAKSPAKQKEPAQAPQSTEPCTGLAEAEKAVASPHPPPPQVQRAALPSDNKVTLAQSNDVRVVLKRASRVRSDTGQGAERIRGSYSSVGCGQG